MIAGSEEQKQRYLPGIASGHAAGQFRPVGAGRRK